MRKKERVRNIKKGMAKSLEFENQYEQALIDLNIDYIRSKSDSWDFVIITPLDYVFVELKYKYHGPNKTQWEFIKKNWTRYLLINLLVHKKKPEYRIRSIGCICCHDDKHSNIEMLHTEHTLHNIYEIAFYPVFRLFGIYNWFIEEYLNKVGQDNILLNYRHRIFTTPARYKHIPNLNILSPEEIKPTQNVNQHLFSKGAHPIILTKVI